MAAGELGTNDGCYGDDVRYEATNFSSYSSFLFLDGSNQQTHAMTKYLHLLLLFPDRDGLMREGGRLSGLFQEEEEAFLCAKEEDLLFGRRRRRRFLFPPPPLILLLFFAFFFFRARRKSPSLAKKPRSRKDEEIISTVQITYAYFYAGNFYTRTLPRKLHAGVGGKKGRIEGTSGKYVCGVSFFFLFLFFPFSSLFEGSLRRGPLSLSSSSAIKQAEDYQSSKKKGKGEKEGRKGRGAS